MPFTQSNNVDTGQLFRYFAFISYCREDEHIAKWLQRKLETYRLPSKIKKENTNLPKRIVPVFRDTTDLGGIHLEESLHSELDDSKYLIVICSKNSTQSPWVNKEIEHFIANGKADKIIPFAVDGSPFSNDPETECIPSAIKKITPMLRSINLFDYGKHKAFINLVATILDLHPDELIKRDRARFRRNLLVALVVSVIFCATLFSVIWQNVEHSAYYGTYITKYEVPVGLNKLTKAERKNRASSFRITKKGGKVVRLETVNSENILTDPAVYSEFTEYPMLEYKYNTNDELVEINAFDTLYRHILTKQLSYGNDNQIAIDFRNAKNELQTSAMQSGYLYYDGFSKSTPTSEIIRQINTYSEKGYCAKVMYYRDTLGTPAHDSFGTCGRLYTYTDDGLLKSGRFLNRNGEICVNKYGYAGGDNTYDDEYNQLQYTCVDLKNQVCTNEKNYAIERLSYDKFGNVTTVKHYSKEDKPCNNENGYFYFENTYVNGNRVSQKFFDCSEKPTTDKNGVHEYAMEYNKNALCVKATCYNANGEMVNSKDDKTSSVEVNYTRTFLPEEYRYFDATGNPCVKSEYGAVYSIKYQYNKAGDIVSEEYFDLDGKPKRSKQGYAEVKTVYNDVGLVKRYEYYDENGELARGVGNYAIAEHEYDPYGNCTEIRYYDEDSNPCFSSEGYSCLKRTFENGNIISERHYDTEEKPVLINNSKYHEIKMEYDENGNTILTAYYDTENRLTFGDENYAVVQYVYDEFGNVTEQRYFEKDGTPSHNYDTYLIKKTYDSRGNMISAQQESYYDVSAYKVEMQYDEFDNLIKKTFLDKNGMLLNSETEHAIERYSYDEKRNMVTYEEEYSSGESDVYEYQYDVWGNITLTKSFEVDASGNKKCDMQLEYSYDGLGNKICQKWLDGNGNLMASSDGYAYVEREYSPEGYVIKEEYYDENNKPCLYNGAFCHLMEYDYAGNVIKYTYYDENKSLLKEADGKYAYKIQEFNSQGKLIRQSLLNENQKPTADANQVSSMLIQYNEIGELAERKYFDVNGNVFYEEILCAAVSEIVEEEIADSYGIREGDVIIKYGDWDTFSDDYLKYRFRGLSDELLRLRESEKEIVIYGERDGQECFITINCDGVLGVMITEKYIDKQKYEEIRKKYKEK